MKFIYQKENVFRVQVDKIIVEIWRCGVIYVQNTNNVKLLTEGNASTFQGEYKN